MARPGDEIVSAQVILRPASGSASEGAITSKNVRDALPSADAVALARRAFAKAGLEIGPVVANSFSITGPARTFNTVFKTRVQRNPVTGETKAISSSGSTAYELPVNGLPRSVASVVDAVTFTPPPDFGPTSY